MGKLVIGILAIFLLLGAFSTPIIDGIKGWRTNDTTESFSVTTGAAETTSNMTLGYDLYQAATAEIVSMTSNITGETPVASAYTEATKFLVLAGLNPASVHTITINYLAETDDSVMRVLGPFLAVLIIGGCIAFIIYGMAHKGRG